MSDQQYSVNGLKLTPSEPQTREQMQAEAERRGVPKGTMPLVHGDTYEWMWPVSKPIGSAEEAS